MEYKLHHLYEIIEILTNKYKNMDENIIFFQKKINVDLLKLVNNAITYYDGSYILGEYPQKVELPAYFIGMDGGLNDYYTLFNKIESFIEKYKYIKSKLKNVETNVENINDKNNELEEKIINISKKLEEKIPEYKLAIESFTHNPRTKMDIIKDAIDSIKTTNFVLNKDPYFKQQIEQMKNELKKIPKKFDVELKTLIKDKKEESHRIKRLNLHLIEQLKASTDPAISNTKMKLIKEIEYIPIITEEEKIRNEKDKIKYCNLFNKMNKNLDDLIKDHEKWQRGEYKKKSKEEINELLNKYDEIYNTYVSSYEDVKNALNRGIVLDCTTNETLNNINKKMDDTYQLLINEITNYDEEYYRGKIEDVQKERMKQEEEQKIELKYGSKRKEEEELRMEKERNIRIIKEKEQYKEEKILQREDRSRIKKKFAQPIEEKEEKENEITNALTIYTKLFKDSYEKLRKGNFNILGHTGYELYSKDTEYKMKIDFVPIVNDIEQKIHEIEKLKKDYDTKWGQSTNINKMYKKSMGYIKYVKDKVNREEQKRINYFSDETEILRKLIEKKIKKRNYGYDEKQYKTLNEYKKRILQIKKISNIFYKKLVEYYNIKGDSDKENQMIDKLRKLNKQFDVMLNGIEKMKIEGIEKKKEEEEEEEGEEEEEEEEEREIKKGEAVISKKQEEKYYCDHFMEVNQLFNELETYEKQFKNNPPKTIGDVSQLKKNILNIFTRNIEIYDEITKKRLTWRDRIYCQSKSGKVGVVPPRDIKKKNKEIEKKYNILLNEITKHEQQIKKKKKVSVSEEKRVFTTPSYKKIGEKEEKKKRVFTTSSFKKKASEVKTANYCNLYTGMKDILRDLQKENITGNESKENINILESEYLELWNNSKKYYDELNNALNSGTEITCMFFDPKIEKLIITIKILDELNHKIESKVNSLLSQIDTHWSRMTGGTHHFNNTHLYTKLHKLHILKGSHKSNNYKQKYYKYKKKYNKLINK